MAISRNLLAFILFLRAAVISSEGARIPEGVTNAAAVNPSGAGKVFNVLDFGVIPDPAVDNVENYVKVWRAACASDVRAKILFPKGDFYSSGIVLEGPCKAPISLQINGNLKAVSHLIKYSTDSWFTFVNVVGMNVFGTGVIDGQGANLWILKEKGPVDLPISFKFTGCNQTTVSGLTSLNPMGCHFSIFCCNGFVARKLNLTAPDQSPHTDGFHISRSSNVKILDTVVATGDDCVGIITGCENVLVRGMTCGPGHGISIGSVGGTPNEKPVKDILFENCTLKGSDNGARIKTRTDSFPTMVRNVTFRNLEMHNVGHAIIIDQLYGNKNAQASKVQISNVKFINIKGTTRTERGVELLCSNAVPCQGIRLSNIDLEYVGNRPDLLPFRSNCTNARVTYDGTQFPPPCV